MAAVSDGPSEQVLSRSIGTSTTAVVKVGHSDACKKQEASNQAKGSEGSALMRQREPSNIPRVIKAAVARRHVQFELWSKPCDRLHDDTLHHAVVKNSLCEQQAAAAVNA